MHVKKGWMNYLALRVLFGAVILLASVTAHAGLISVDWNPDVSVDGFSTGDLGGTFVSVSSPVVNNSGITFGQNWASLSATDDVPGISDPGVVAEAAAVGMTSIEAAGGTQRISFGSAVINPILMFNWTDPAANLLETFDFADSITLTILDSYISTNVSLGAGNIITATGSNTAQEGFAVQLAGSFTSINIDVSGDDTLGFTVATSVPEPATIMLLGFGLVGLAGFGRKKFKK